MRADREPPGIPHDTDARCVGRYIGRGGRLCYLGGNGFYWRIAVSDAIPDVLEVRRAEGGIRAWDAAPGEAHHQLDGAYGGLWRRLGRPPQMLAGVGFSSQGLFEGSLYRRLPASFDPDVAWIFDGVEGEVLGDFGLSGGGAAGFELDRAGSSARNVAERRDPGPVGGAPGALRGGAGGAAEPRQHRDWRGAARLDPGGDRAFRDGGRRGGVLDRIDHVLRQLVARNL